MMIGGKHHPWSQKLSALLGIHAKYDVSEMISQRSSKQVQSSYAYFESQGTGIHLFTPKKDHLGGKSRLRREDV